MLLTATYWAAAEHWNFGVAWKKALLSIRVVLPLDVLVAQGAALLGTRIIFGSPVRVNGGFTSACHCLTDRLINLQTDTGGRLDMVKAGLSLFAHNPIFGGGLGSFVGLVKGYEYPHNVFLEIGGELGLIGLLLIFVPLGFGWLRLAWQGIRTADAAIATLLGLMLAYLVAANFSGDIPSDRGLWIFGIVAMKFGLAGWRMKDRLLITAGLPLDRTRPGA